MAACCVSLLLAGCPQLLEDGFADVGLVGEAGAGGSSGAGTSTGSGGSVSAGAGGSVDPTRARVVSIVPPDGARGVASDATIVITFSEPMDPASTEAAYTSPDIPVDAVTFMWNQDHTVLAIKPNSPLEVATGVDPEAVAPASYEIDLTETARARSGRFLVTQHVEFSVVREITQSLAAVLDRDLTGNFRSDGSYGVVDCEAVDFTVCAGDTLSGGEPTTYKAFATFDLTALPPEVINVTAARLDLELGVLFGTPFADLGALNVEQVAFDVIGAEAFAAEPLSALGTMATAASAGDVISADVLPAVIADRARGRTQYRLAYSRAFDDGSDVDIFVSDWSSLGLHVTYLLP